MNLTKREKQLIWRGLCDSEKTERTRLTNLTSGKNKVGFNTQAQRKMINTSTKRLEEITELKDKWFPQM